MFNGRTSIIIFAIAIVAGAAVAVGTRAAQADHRCDPVSDAGWRTVVAHEVISQVDSAPYREGASGNWFVDRTTNVLPFCHYFDEIGNYSLRSYSLSPTTTKERIGICLGTPSGGSVPVPPYAGRCPPE